MKVTVRDIRMRVIEENSCGPEYFVDDGDPRGKWRREDMTKPNEIGPTHFIYGVVAEATLVIKTLDKGGFTFERTIQTPGTWKVWLTGEEDPYAQEIYKEERALMLDILKGMNLKVPA